ncbi:MAG: hydroxyacid dehydrogenase [Sphingobacteriales bacterium]|nr:MAG: hydroxyacid dehydrogenase [Sphingobacteriales bacterium]
MRSEKTVLIAAPVHPVLTEGLEAMGYLMRMVPEISQADADRLLEGCEGVITSTRLQLTRELLVSHPALQWIGRMGSGMEVIDVDAATEQGIAVFASPEGNRNAVAEHALGMLLSLLKKIPGAVREVKQGIWLREENRGEELEGKTIGLIGFGHTGRAFAKLLQGFDVTILAYDPYNTAPDPGYVRRASLAEIQESADVLSFHVPIRPETRYYFDAAFLAAFRKPLVLLNTSRGEVVRSEVVEEGLLSGRLKAVALDVWEGEPLPKMSDAEQQRLLRLAQRPDVLITPHIAGYSVEALYKMSVTLLHKVKTLLIAR